MTISLPSSAMHRSIATSSWVCPLLVRAMEELAAMFPAIDGEVIAAVLRETRNDVGAAVERLLEMSSSVPPAPPLSSQSTVSSVPPVPPPSSQTTVWPRASRVVKPLSSAWDGGYQRGHGFAGSFRPPTHYLGSQPWYYAGPLQQAGLASPSYHCQSVSRAPSLHGSAQQASISPAVRLDQWPSVTGGSNVTSTGQTKKRQLIILRGLPGSGKSTLARQLVGTSGIILSTDDLFVVNGQYLFDPSKLGENHEKNKQRAREALQKRLSPVIIDNTNTAAWEMKPYVTMGLESGYEIKILEPTTEWKFDVRELARRNSHGVPRESIERMVERYERNVTVDSILSSQHPPERREPPLVRGRVSGNPYSSPPSKRLRENASSKASQRAPPSSYRGNHQHIHLPASRPTTQETWGRVEPGRAPRGAVGTQRYHSSMERDVWSFKDDSTIEAGRQSPPIGHASVEELPSVIANAVPHVLLSPEQHSDSSIDDPAIIQKGPTAHQEARPEHPASDGQCTPQNSAESKLPEFFPAADDTTLLLQRPALSSQESDSGDYFPSGYLLAEQNGDPLVISTPDEHHKDTAPCVPPFVPSIAPPSEVPCNRESDMCTAYQNKQVPTLPSNDVLSSDSTAPPALFTSGHVAECGGVEGDLAECGGVEGDLAECGGVEGDLAECGGVEGDLGFLKECFPDLKAGYLEELYQLCERDVEKAVSCVLGYPHTSREGGAEGSNNVLRSEVPVAASDTDTKAATKQVLEYLQTDSGVPHSSWVRHRDKSSDTGTLPDPDCVDDEAIARQLQQELDHEVQTLHTTHPPGPSQDEDKLKTNSPEIETPVGDANLVLKLTPSLAQQLQQMFGSITTLLPSPGTMTDEDLVVLLSERAAREIHKKWCDTLEGKRNEYQYHLQKQLQEDESMARELQEVEDSRQGRRPLATGWQEARHSGRSSSAGMKPYHKTDPSSSAGGGVSSLNEVMTEQLTGEQKDRETTDSLKAICEKMTMARKIQLNKLYSDFPQLERMVINKTLVQNHLDFDRATAELQVLVTGVDMTDGNSPSRKCSPPHDSTRTRRHHPSSSASSTPKKHPPTFKLQKSPKSGKSDKAAHPTPDLTQEDKEQLYNSLRAEATVHANLRAEAFQKAAHARSRKLWQVASFYAQQGHTHTDKMNAANRRAAELIFKQTNKQSSSDSLDLHGLHVSEALEALQEKLATTRRGECVQVITGRGIHSKGREARLKPAVSHYLQQNGYTFDEPNAGMLRVRIK